MSDRASSTGDGYEQAGGVDYCQHSLDNLHASATDTPRFFRTEPPFVSHIRV